MCVCVCGGGGGGGGGLTYLGYKVMFPQNIFKTKFSSLLIKFTIIV